MEALSFLVFVTEKRGGRVKGNTCDIGSNQQTFDDYNRKDGSSPTCSTDGFIISTTIGIHERCDITTLDIQGVFPHATSNDNIIMLLKSKIC